MEEGKAAKTEGEKRLKTNAVAGQESKAESRERANFSITAGRSPPSLLPLLFPGNKRRPSGSERDSKKRRGRKVPLETADIKEALPPPPAPRLACSTCDILS